MNTNLHEWIHLELVILKESQAKQVDVTYYYSDVNSLRLLGLSLASFGEPQHIFSKVLQDMGERVGTPTGSEAVRLVVVWSREGGVSKVGRLWLVKIAYITQGVYWKLLKSDMT